MITCNVGDNLVNCYDESRYENNLSLAKCEKIKNINILHLLGGDSYI